MESDIHVYVMIDQLMTEWNLIYTSCVMIDRLITVESDIQFLSHD